jgi:hypothetical protein
MYSQTRNFTTKDMNSIFSLSTCSSNPSLLLYIEYIPLSWYDIRWIVLTDERKQRQANHNTTTYYVYWRTTTTINPIIIRPHCMFTDKRLMIGLSLFSVSKHNMWSYYDWVVVVLRDDNNDNPIITRPHIVFTDRRQQRQPNHNMTTYCVY